MTTTAKTTLKKIDHQVVDQIHSTIYLTTFAVLRDGNQIGTVVRRESGHFSAHIRWLVNGDLALHYATKREAVDKLVNMN